MIVNRSRGPRRSIRLPIVVAGVLTACSSAPGQGPDATGSPALATIGAAAVATASPTPAVSSTATSPDPAIAEPPAARLSVDGGDQVVGELGSFTWQGSGSDSPWLDGNPIHIGSGETLTLTLDGAVVIERWTASRVAAATLDDTAAVGLGEGARGEPAVFPGPPPGTWSVVVNVWFVDNQGSAAWYWLVEVD